MRKQQLRQQLLMRREALTNTEVATATGLITAKLLRQVDWSRVGSVHIYTSMIDWKEIGTTDFIAQLGKLYPRVRVHTSDSLPESVFPQADYDVIVVPVLGFDARGYRIGLGKGWYDRFLASQKKARKIGIAYDWAKLDIVPDEPHDIPLDIVITEAHEFICD